MNTFQTIFLSASIFVGTIYGMAFIPEKSEESDTASAVRGESFRGPVTRLAIKEYNLHYELGGKWILPDRGLIKHCVENPDYCNQTSETEKFIDMTTEKWNMLMDIHFNSGHHIIACPAGIAYADIWTPGYECGEQKGSAMLKQEMLVKNGWPMSALPLRLVTDPKTGRDFAVLTVRTPDCDYIVGPTRYVVTCAKDSHFIFRLWQTPKNAGIWDVDPRAVRGS